MEPNNDLDFDAVLAHYGVKGMKWGVRKDRTAVEVSTKHTPGKRVRAQGGKYQNASEDAIRAAIHKQTARKSTTDALSNKELQELITRMNLEQQYDRLDPNRGNPGRAFVKKFLDLGGGDMALAKIAPIAGGLTPAGAAVVGTLAVANTVHKKTKKKK